MPGLRTLASRSLAISSLAAALLAQSALTPAVAHGQIPSGGWLASDFPLEGAQTVMPAAYHYADDPSVPSNAPRPPAESVADATSTAAPSVADGSATPDSPGCSCVSACGCENGGCGGNGFWACDRWYLGVSGGAAWRELVQEVGDPTTFLQFNVGFVGNVALGYRLGDNFRLEAEYSDFDNKVSYAGSGGLSSDATGNISLHALTLNLYYDFDHTFFCWRPFIGGGVGFYQSEINSMYPAFFTTAGAPYANQPLNTTSNVPFVYQFRVGATRQLSERTELFFDYRYFHGDQLTFASQPFSEFAPTFYPDGAWMNAAELGLRIKF